MSSHRFVSRSRRVRFDLTLRIIDLNNVPLVSGTSLVKWDLPHSTAAEHRGKTARCAIRDHRVAYEYENTVSVRMTVGKDGLLQECSIHFEIQQDYGSGGRNERIKLGDVRLNLAEYVDASEAGPGGRSPSNANGNLNDESQGVSAEEGVVRRYLMQESKINSTLKIGIHMRQTEGTKDFYAPALKSAPVFGGIAGIISTSEPTPTPHGASAAGAAASANGDATHEGLDAGNVPTLMNTNKETGEMQDMYRRTLAAFWSSQPGELKADECIEDIFAGGDGWGPSGRPQSANEQKPAVSAADPTTSSSATTTPSQDADGQRVGPAARGFFNFGSKHPHASKGKVVRKGKGEVDEWDIREDLRSWTVREKGYT